MLIRTYIHEMTYQENLVKWEWQMEKNSDLCVVDQILLIQIHFRKILDHPYSCDDSYLILQTSGSILSPRA
jgi:hypothetical protein